MALNMSASASMYIAGSTVLDNTIYNHLSGQLFEFRMTNHIYYANTQSEPE